MTSPDYSFVLPLQDRMNGTSFSFYVWDDNTPYSSYSSNSATISSYGWYGWDYSEGLFALTKSSNVQTWDQQDIARFLLADASDLIGYTGDKKIHQTLVNWVDNPINGENYRTSIPDIVNLSFNETSLGGDIILMQGWADSEDVYGLGWFPTDSSNQDTSDVFLNINSPEVQSSPSPGTKAFYTLLHEMGHAVGGLKHIASSSDYNSQKYSIMSTNLVSSGWVSSLQLYDILAIQENYEDRNYTTRQGNTHYSLDRGLGFPSLSAANVSFLSLWDGGGLDTIDVSDFLLVSQVDLRQGKFSSINYNYFDSDADPEDPTLADPGNISVSYYTVLEDVIGSSHSSSNPDIFGQTGDIIIGNAWNNHIWGLDGDDKIYGDGIVYDGDPGFHSEDEFRPWNTTDNIAPADDLSGNDTLYGGDGDDELYGGGGDDWLYGDRGDDDILGHAGFDQSAYRAFSANYTLGSISSFLITKVNPTTGDYTVQTNFLGGVAELDVFTDIERIAHAEQLANTYLTSVQNSPSISARSGGYVSFWQSAGQGGKSQAIVRREFDESGNLTGTESLVMNAGGSNQLNPESDQTLSGGYVVAFQGRNDDNKVKTFAKVFDSSGNPGTLDIEVFKDPDTGNPALDDPYKTTEFAKDVAVLTSGNILAVAQASGNFTQSGQFDIIGKFLDSGGNAIGQKFIVNDDAQAGWQTEPSVAALSNGFAVVTWRSLDQHYYGVFYKVLDSSGGTIKGTTQANDTYYYTQEDSDVAGLANGGFVITWTDQGSADGSGYGVFFKMFDNFGNEVATYDRDGNPLSGNVLVNQQTTGTQWQSEVTALADGGFVITFTDNQSTSDGNAASVWAQQYDRFGMPIQDNFLVNITTSGTQQHTAVAALNNGDFAIAWEDQTGDIYERLYSNSAPIPTAPPGSSSAMSSSASGSSSSLAAEPGVPVDPLYEEPDFIIRGNDLLDLIEVSKRDYGKEYVEVLQGFNVEEGDVLDLSDLFAGRDIVSEAIGDFIALSEADGDTLVLVDRDGSRDHHEFRTVAYFQDTLGLDTQQLLSDGHIIV